MPKGRRDSLCPDGQAPVREGVRVAILSSSQLIISIKQIKTSFFKILGANNLLQKSAKSASSAVKKTSDRDTSPAKDGISARQVLLEAPLLHLSLLWLEREANTEPQEERHKKAGPIDVVFPFLSKLFS